MNYFDRLRPYLAKLFAPIFGALITGFVAWLKTRWGIEVDLSSAEINALVSQLGELATFAISTGIAAVTINKAVNPGNAASSHLASEEKQEAQLLKTVSDQTAERMARAKR